MVACTDVRTRILKKESFLKCNCTVNFEWEPARVDFRLASSIHVCGFACMIVKYLARELESIDFKLLLEVADCGM